MKIHAVSMFALDPKVSVWHISHYFREQRADSCLCGRLTLVQVYLFRHLFFITRDSTKVVGKQMLVGRQIAIENLKVEDTVNVEGRGSIKGRVKPGELNQLLAVRNNDPALMKHSTKAKKGATLQRTFGSGQQARCLTSETPFVQTDLHAYGFNR